jgi:hypothetical protein
VAVCWIVTSERQYFSHRVGHADLERGIGLACELNMSNVVALTGGSEFPWRSASSVVIYDDRAKRIAYELHFKYPVLNIHLTDQ